MRVTREQAAAIRVPALVAVGSRDRGMVRVVAQPWAEVYLDGELSSTDPREATGFTPRWLPCCWTRSRGGWAPSS